MSEIVGPRPHPFSVTDDTDTGMINIAVREASPDGGFKLIYVPEWGNFTTWHQLADGAGYWERDTTNEAVMTHTLLVSERFQQLAAEAPEGDTRERLLRAARNAKA